MGIQIEAMRIDDFDAVMALWKASEGVGFNEMDTQPCIASYLERNPGMSFVARENGKLIGAVLCGHDGRRGYMHHLAVAAECRKRGIGRGLVAACFAELAKIGMVKCNIFVYAHNAEGQAFWKREGWNPRVDLLVMQSATR